MSASTRPAAMAHLRRDEGGYVNHKLDPGGATNHGITQAVYDADRRDKRLPTRSVKLITEAEVSDIYRTRYANPIRYDDLPAGVDYATLDAAVNSGVSRGAKWLQLSVGATADGKVGTQTVAKANAAEPIRTIKSICSRRLSFVQSLKTWATFGKGWGRRIAGVEANAVKMSLEARTTSARGVTAHLEAEAAVAMSVSKSQNSAAGATAVASGTSTTSAATITDLDTATIVILSIVAVGLVALTIHLVRKSRINRKRAAAYAAVAAGA